MFRRFAIHHPRPGRGRLREILWGGAAPAGSSVLGGSSL